MLWLQACLRTLAVFELSCELPGGGFELLVWSGLLLVWSGLLLVWFGAGLVWVVCSSRSSSYELPELLKLLVWSGLVWCWCWVLSGLV